MSIPNSRLLGKIQNVASRAGFTDFAVAFFDYETHLAFSFRGDEWFHAASTIKAAFLLAVFKAVEAGGCRWDDPLHVRNRFASAAGGSWFRVNAGRDGDATVHQRIGRTMPIEALARAMIVRSSNLATNLLFEFLGLEFIQKVVREAGLDGIKVLRGVEDDPAFEAGINNEITADALVKLFRDVADARQFSAQDSERLLEIFLAQEFNSMIPARLPPEARVAHKTGEISTCAHDAGIVYLPGRKPYVLAILTQMPAGVTGRNRQVAAISKLVCDYLVGGHD